MAMETIDIEVGGPAWNDDVNKVTEAMMAAGLKPSPQMLIAILGCAIGHMKSEGVPLNNIVEIVTATYSIAGAGAPIYQH